MSLLQRMGSTMPVIEASAYVANSSHGSITGNLKAEHD